MAASPPRSMNAAAIAVGTNDPGATAAPNASTITASSANP